MGTRGEEESAAIGPCRSSEIAAGTRCTVRLAYYRPGSVQEAHHHANLQMSFLLAGSLSERSEGKEFLPVARQAGLLPPGHRHKVCYGDAGALLISIECPEAASVAPDRRSWRSYGAPLARKLALLADASNAIDDLAEEVMVHCEAANDEAARGTAPPWLLRAIEHLYDDPSAAVDALARDAGVHRVHFSRRFLRHTGLSPTEFRLARKCAHAARLTIDGQMPLAQAAALSGFADQAHWSRTCKALTGLTPRHLRRVLAH